MQHLLFTQKVRPEKRKEYIEEHKNAPKQLLEVLKESGFQREIIWMDGDRIYIYVMSEDVQAAVDSQKKTDIFQDWLEKMEPLLEQVQDYSEEGKISGLEKVFDLEMQLNE